MDNLCEDIDGVRFDTDWTPAKDMTAFMSLELFDLQSLRVQWLRSCTHERRLASLSPSLAHYLEPIYINTSLVLIAILFYIHFEALPSNLPTANMDVNANTSGSNKHSESDRAQMWVTCHGETPE
jgi:hypothetical protein